MATPQLPANGLRIRRSSASSTPAPGIRQGPEYAKLVDISRCLPLEPEVRHFYSGEILVESFLALALQIEASPLGAMMGNVYLRVARPGIPTRLFTRDGEALAWLGQVATS